MVGNVALPGPTERLSVLTPKLVTNCINLTITQTYTYSGFRIATLYCIPMFQRNNTLGVSVNIYFSFFSTSATLGVIMYACVRACVCVFSCGHGSSQVLGNRKPAGLAIEDPLAGVHLLLSYHGYNRIYMHGYNQPWL